MRELSILELSDVGGASPIMTIVTGLAAGATILGNSGPIYDFLSGVFDGMGGIK
jgi:hypothetical protein